MFSTNLGKTTSRMATEPLPYTIVHSNPLADVKAMMLLLQEKFPKQCTAICYPINVKKYYSDYDLALHGFTFLNTVLQQIASQNEVTVKKINDDHARQRGSLSHQGALQRSRLGVPPSTQLPRGSRSVISYNVRLPAQAQVERLHSAPEYPPVEEMPAPISVGAPHRADGLVNHWTGQQFPVSVPYFDQGMTGDPRFMLTLTPLHVPLDSIRNNALDVTRFHRTSLEAPNPTAFYSNDARVQPVQDRTNYGGNGEDRGSCKNQEHYTYGISSEAPSHTVQFQETAKKEPQKTIYVNGLPGTATTEHLRDLFSRFGPINFINIRNHSRQDDTQFSNGCYAFITFFSTADACEAVNTKGLQLGPYPLRVNRSKPRMCAPYEHVASDGVMVRLPTATNRSIFSPQDARYVGPDAMSPFESTEGTPKSSRNNGGYAGSRKSVPSSTVAVEMNQWTPQSGGSPQKRKKKRGSRTSSKHTSPSKPVPKKGTAETIGAATVSINAEKDIEDLSSSKVEARQSTAMTTKNMVVQRPEPSSLDFTSRATFPELHHMTSTPNKVSSEKISKAPGHDQRSLAVGSQRRTKKGRPQSKAPLQDISNQDKVAKSLTSAAKPMVDVETAIPELKPLVAADMSTEPEAIIITKKKEGPLTWSQIASASNSTFYETKAASKAEDSADSLKSDDTEAPQVDDGR
ncbi:MAG: hypothetical protein M1827_001087 [Pycnora praestabilis]|nr:MAG: hypothetical protein M1827_001087 [Pycnora praestabilis]